MGLLFFLADLPTPRVNHRLNCLQIAYQLLNELKEELGFDVNLPLSSNVDVEDLSVTEALVKAPHQQVAELRPLGEELVHEALRKNLLDFERDVGVLELAEEVVLDLEAH